MPARVRGAQQGASWKVTRLRDINKSVWRPMSLKNSDSCCRATGTDLSGVKLCVGGSSGLRIDWIKARQHRTASPSSPSLIPVAQSPRKPSAGHLHPTYSFTFYHHLLAQSYLPIDDASPLSVGFTFQQLG